jgi:hypothetical protein
MVNIQHFHWIYKCSSVAEYHINSAQIICGFRMMGLMPQKYPRVKANVWLFCMQVREVRIDGCDLVFLAKSKEYHTLLP